MTNEEKAEFFAKLDQLVERSKDLAAKTRELGICSAERARNSHIAFEKFMEERRRQEGGAQQPPSGN